MPGRTKKKRESSRAEKQEAYRAMLIDSAVRARKDAEHADNFEDFRDAKERELDYIRRYEAALTAMVETKD